MLDFIARRPLLLGVAFLAVALSPGCATSGGYQAVSRTHWREDMGRMSRNTLQQGLDKIFRKHSLDIAQYGGSDMEFHYESRWIPRELMAPEEAGGTTGARNRIVIRGHRVGSGTYRITWDVENEVTTAVNHSWHPAMIPPEVVEQFRPIYSDLTLEVRTGIRLD